MTGVVAALAVRLGLIAVSSVRQRALPWPGAILGTVAVYAALALVAESSEQAAPVAAVLAWALILASLINGRLLAPVTTARGGAS